MKKRALFFFALFCAVLQGTWATTESVTYTVCSWDAENKKVLTTQATHECTLIEGEIRDNVVLGAEGKETWYAVKGRPLRFTIQILGSVHLVLLDGSKLYCNHIKLEDDNKLYIYGQSADERAGMIQAENNNGMHYNRVSEEAGKRAIYKILRS